MAKSDRDVIVTPPEAVRAWRARMGWTQAEAAAALNRGRDTILRAEEAGATLTLALAMAALEAGLPPVAAAPEPHPARG